MRLETFFDNFELLTDAPNGVQKLRELILQLAVQGKLVPQDPNDEPASVLLEKIKAEREWLIKDKKIKKPKPLPPIAPNEIPYKKPKNWIWCRLGEIIQISSGDALTSSKMSQNGRIPVYGGNGITGYHNQNNVSKPTLVIGRVGYYCGSVHLTPSLAWITDNAFSTYFSESNIYVHFLYWLLKGTNLQKNNSATAQPVISGSKIYPIVVGLSPINEQKRIAVKVQQLMALCDELEVHQQKRREGCVRLNNAAIDQLLTIREPENFSKHWRRICDNFDLLYSAPENIGKLRQAIFQLAVQGKLVPQDPNNEPASVLLNKIKAEKNRLIKEGKISKPKQLPPIQVNEVPYELPEEWQWARFGDIILDIESGWSPMCEKRSKEVEEWGVLKVSAVSWDKFNPHENKALPVGFKPRLEHEARVGDFLMSRANTSQLVGKSVIVETTPERLLLSDKLLRLFFSNLTDKRFFNLYNNAPTARDYYSKKATGTSTSMRNISRNQIHEMPIPIPPLPEQRCIITKVEQLMALCDDLKAKLIQSQTDSEKLMDAAVRQLLLV